jgi:2,3,4,5-tetrahydropyridine-2-carboxylate N-succinyltransferase
LVSALKTVKAPGWKCLRAAIAQPSAELVAAIAPILGYTEGNQAIAFTTAQAAQLAEAVKGVDAAQAALLTRLAESHKPLVATMLAEDAQLTSTPEAYLKLHLLSHRLVKPHGVSLAGIFPLLPNVAWTSQGAIDLAELAELNWKPACAASCWKCSRWTSSRK